MTKSETSRGQGAHRCRAGQRERGDDRRRESAVAEVVVEDGTAPALGGRGVPAGWKTYATPGGRPAYDFTMLMDDGRRALRLRSHDEHSTIAKALAVDLEITPVLEWRWKIVTLPTDLTAHLFVVWPRLPAPLRSRRIGYVWDPAAPAGTIEKSRKTGTTTFVILRSGPPSSAAGSPRDATSARTRSESSVRRLTRRPRSRSRSTRTTLTRAPKVSSAGSRLHGRDDDFTVLVTARLLRYSRSALGSTRCPIRGSR